MVKLARLRRSLSHTWQYVVSGISCLSGENVNFVSDTIEAVPHSVNFL